MENKIIFGADGLKIFGPKIDGTYSVTLTTGEYERAKVGALLDLVGKPLKVTIEVASGAAEVKIPDIS